MTGAIHTLQSVSMHLTQDQLTFLAGFANSTQGRLLRQVLEGRLTDASKELRSLIGEQLYRAQGKALELDALIALLDTAQTNLTRNQSARSQGHRQDV